jgi:hypothetical protein
LRRIPAIVSFLNPQPALSLVGGNRSSCPTADLRPDGFERLSRVDSGPSRRPIGVAGLRCLRPFRRPRSGAAANSGNSQMLLKPVSTPPHRSHKRVPMPKMGQLPTNCGKRIGRIAPSAAIPPIAGARLRALSGFYGSRSRSFHRGGLEKGVARCGHGHPAEWQVSIDALIAAAHLDSRKNLRCRR